MRGYCDRQDQTGTTITLCPKGVYERELLEVTVTLEKGKEKCVSELPDHFVKGPAVTRTGGRGAVSFKFTVIQPERGLKTLNSLLEPCAEGCFYSAPSCPLGTSKAIGNVRQSPAVLSGSPGFLELFSTITVAKNSREVKSETERK